MAMEDRPVEVVAELADGIEEKRKQANGKQGSKVTHSVSEPKLIARMQIERKYSQGWRGMDRASR
jgi:hypothetical protein